MSLAKKKSSGRRQFSGERRREAQVNIGQHPISQTMDNNKAKKKEGNEMEMPQQQYHARGIFRAY